MEPPKSNKPVLKRINRICKAAMVTQQELSDALGIHIVTMHRFGLGTARNRERYLIWFNLILYFAENTGLKKKDFLQALNDVGKL